MSDFDSGQLEREVGAWRLTASKRLPEFVQMALQSKDPDKRESLLIASIRRLELDEFPGILFSLSLIRSPHLRRIACHEAASRWNDLTPLSPLTTLEQMPEFPDRDGWLRRLGETMFSSSPKEFLEWYEESNHPIHFRTMMMDGALSLWANSNPESSLQYLTRLPYILQTRHLVSRHFEHRASFADFEDYEKSLELLKGRIEALDAVAIAAENLASDKPPETLEWAQGLDPHLRLPALQAAIKTYARLEPDKADAWLDRYNGNHKSELIQSATAGFAESRPMAVFRWIQNLKGHEASAAISVLPSLFYETRLRLPPNFLEAFPPENINRDVLSLCLAYAEEQSPEELNRWLYSPGEPELKSRARAALARFKALRSIDKAESIKNKMVESTRRDLLGSELYGGLAGRDPAEALRRLSKLADSPERKLAMQETVRQLAVVHPERAFAIALSEEGGESRRRMLEAVLATWFRLNGRNAAAALRRVEPETRTRLLHLYSVWAELDPKAASAAALSIGDPLERDSAVFSVVSAIAPYDTLKALSLAININDLSMRLDAHKQIGIERANHDLNGALKWARTLGNQILRKHVILAIANSISRTRPEHAANLALEAGANKEEYMQVLRHFEDEYPLRATHWIGQNILSEEWRKDLIRNLTSRWALNDTGAALQLAKSMNNREAREEMIQTIALSLAEHDPLRSLDLVEEYLSKERREESIPEILGAISTQAPSIAVDRANRLPTAEQRSKALSVISEKLTDFDPSLAFRLILSIEDREEQGGAMNNLMSTWAGTSPEDAYRALLTLNDSDLRSKSIVASLSSLVNWDRNKAEALMNQLPLDLKNNSIGIVAESRAKQDPKQAYQWALRRDKTNERLQALKGVLSVWVHEDPDAALAAVLDLTTEMKSECINYIVNQSVKSGNIDLLKKQPDLIRHVPYFDSSIFSDLDPELTLELAEQENLSSYQRIQLRSSAIQRYAKTSPERAEQLLNQDFANLTYKDALESNFLTTLAEQNPEEALRYARLHSSEMEGEILEVWMGKDSDKALSWVRSIGDRQLRERMFVVCANWYSRNQEPEKIELLISEMQDEKIEKDLYTALITAQSGIQPVEAFRQAVAMDDLELFDRVKQALVLSLLNYNREQALQLVSEINSLGLKYSYSEMLLNQLTRSNPETALDNLHLLSGNSRKNIIASAISEMINLDAEAAKRWVQEKLPSGEGIAGLETYVNEMMSKQPLELMTFLNRLPAFNEKKNMLSRVTAAWYNKDPSAATTWLQGQPDREFRNELAMSLFWDSQAQDQPERLFELINMLPDNSSALNGVQSFFASWAEQDLQTSLSRAGTIIDQKIRRAANRGIVMTWANSNPSQAINWAVQNLEEGKDKQDTINEILLEWTDKDPRLVLESWNRLPENLRDPSVLSDLFNTFSKYDLDTARNLIAELREPERSSAMRGLAYSLAEQDSMKAAEYALGIANDNERASALRWVFSHWASQSLEEARERAITIANPKDREIVVESIVSSFWNLRDLSTSDSVDLVRWAFSLAPDSQGVGESSSNIIYNLYRENPERAKSFAETLGGSSIQARDYLYIGLIRAMIFDFKDTEAELYIQKIQTPELKTMIEYIVPRMKENRR